MSLLKIHNLSKSFDNGKTKVLDTVSFELEKGRVLTIVGESGSGKTTLIRLIAGLETPDDGIVELNDTVLSSVDIMVRAEKRNVGLVFQDYALFPHMTVQENIMYGIHKQHDKKERVAEVLELVGLSGFESRYPHQLSGGQQQRVALARALAPRPEVLILDEPFSNLDVILKDQLRREIFEIIHKTGVTAIFVTHDTDDALSVSDSIIVLQKGKMIQNATAFELFNAPKTPYVASLFSAVVNFTTKELEEFRYPASESTSYMLRTSSFRIEEDTDYSVTARVLSVLFMGAYYQISVETPQGNLYTICSSNDYQNKNITIGFNQPDIFHFERQIN